MARSVPHQSVYALASGRGVTCKRPPRAQPASSRPLNPVPTGDMNEENKAMGGNRSTTKRSQVAPESAFSTSKTQLSNAAPSVATTSKRAPALARDRSTNTNYPSPDTVLPAIQRGLRAHRIAPDDFEFEREGGPLTAGDSSPEVLAPTHGANVFIGDRRRIYPESDVSREGGHEKGQFTSSIGREGGVLESPLKSRLPPPATNLDFTTSASLSESSNLPKLELEVNSRSPISSPTRPASPIDVEGRDPYDGMDKSSSGAAPGQPETGAVESTTSVLPRGDECPPGEVGTDASTPDGRRTPAETTCLPENNISLGRHHSEKLREGLNRTLSPQGIEVTAVIIRSAELPDNISEQMSGITLNISIADEQRSTKSSDAQFVRHEEDVKDLHQQLKLDRAIAAREGDEKVEQVRLKVFSLD